MSLSPAIAKNGNRKALEVTLQGFSFVCRPAWTFATFFAYWHYSICNFALQDTVTFFNISVLSHIFKNFIHQKNLYQLFI